MPKIFISYRRNDSAAHAGRLYDHLMDRFGQGQVGTFLLACGVFALVSLKAYWRTPELRWAD